jgi:S-formylglutathione hydrolase
MESYITGELRQLVASRFPADPARCGIFGHSMGGHGALTLALRHPELYRSVSAFAPIAAPSLCPWGEKALAATWAMTAACGGTTPAPGGGWPALPAHPDRSGHGRPVPAHPAQPGPLRAGVCRRPAAALRRHAGYDHGYYFISTFMADHLAHHAQYLKA